MLEVVSGHWLISGSNVQTHLHCTVDICHCMGLPYLDLGLNGSNLLLGVLGSLLGNVKALVEL